MYCIKMATKRRVEKMLRTYLQIITSTNLKNTYLQLHLSLCQMCTYGRIHIYVCYIKKPLQTIAFHCLQFNAFTKLIIRSPTLHTFCIQKYTKIMCTVIFDIFGH